MVELLYRLDTIHDEPLDLNEPFDPRLRAPDQKSVAVSNFSVRPTPKAKPIEAMICHRTLAHANPEVMDAWAKANGRHISEVKCRQRIIEGCGACNQGKKNKPGFFKDNPEVDANFAVGEALHIDFRGAWPIKSIHGNRYRMVITVKGGVTFEIYTPTRSSDYYFPRLLEVFALIERRSGKRIKHIRGDGEFTSNVLIKFCADHGLI